MSIRITPKSLLTLLSISLFLSPFSVPLHPIAASNLLTLKFALDVWCDPQFSAFPKAIHFAGEVFRKFG